MFSVQKSILVLGNNKFHENICILAICFLDKISKLIISSSSSIVAGIAVTFTASVELQYGTRYFTPVTFQWSYSDGKNSGPIHVFDEAGTYQVNCTAINYVNNFSNSTSVTVEKGTNT